jgi:hypothetical protein
VNILDIFPAKTFFNVRPVTFLFLGYLIKSQAGTNAALGELFPAKQSKIAAFSKLHSLLSLKGLLY